MTRATAWSILSLLVLALCAMPVVPQDEEGTRAKDDPRQAVKDAAAKLGKSKNYTYAYTPELDSGDGMLSRFTKRFSQDAAGVVDNEKEVFTARTDRIEMARKGDKVAVKVREEWQDADDLNGGGGRQGRALQTLVDQLAERETPHESVATWLKKTGDLKEEEEKVEVDGKDCIVYRGTLTEKGAEEALMKPIGSFADRLGAEIEDPSGTARFFVDGDGILRQSIIKVEGTLGVSFGGMQQSFDLTAKYTTTIAKIDESELDLPAEAKEILGLEDEEDDKEEDGDDE